MRAFRAAPANAGGLDGWFPAELRAMPATAAAYLAAMLQHIEAGGRWSAALLKARCAWLGKQAEPTLDATAHRGLLILSSIYRTYAKVRLSQMREWIRSWAPGELFFRRPGEGG